MGKLVKHGSQGVADGTVAKDSFDMPETLPQIEGLEAGKQEGIQSKEMSKDVLPEVESAKDDVPADEAWVEEKSGKIAPQQNAGSKDTPLEDPDLARFANQDGPDYQGTKDNMEGDEVLKKAVGHKTKSGL